MNDDDNLDYSNDWAYNLSKPKIATYFYMVNCRTVLWVYIQYLRYTFSIYLYMYPAGNSC